MRNFTNFADNSRSCRGILANFLNRWDVSQQETFDFGADPHYDPDPGILTEFLPLRDRRNYKNCASNSINNDYDA